MAPIEGDTDEVQITEPAPPQAPCWRACSEPHSNPDDIYRCSACGLALCRGQVYVNGPTMPLAHRPEKAGRRKGENSKGFCGPVEFLGEATERTR